MPILAPSQKSTLATELAKPAYTGLATAQTKADALNAPTTVTPTVPKPLVISTLLGYLSAPSQAAVKALPYLPRVLDDINGQARASVGLWASFLSSNGVITGPEATAIMGDVNGTVSGPSTGAPSAFQSLFPTDAFTLPDGTRLSGMATAAMVTEALS